MAIDINVNQKVLISTPGVPGELVAMLEEIRLRLQQTFLPWNKIDRHFKISNISESGLSDMLQEFEQAYTYGDDVRFIDWNVTARFHQPYVKIFEEERELTVMLVIDTSTSTLFGTQNMRKTDMITELAAVLSFSAISPVSGF